jgi:alpha-mannosidase
MDLIGNAHLDPVWLWQWPEGLQEAKATVRSALDRLNEISDFVFISSAAAISEWVDRQIAIMSYIQLGNGSAGDA